MRRSEPTICYTTQCCLLCVCLILVITDTKTPIGTTERPKESAIESAIELTTTVGPHYANESFSVIPTDGHIGPTLRGKSRAKRSIVQLAGMIRCVSGCDPFSYKSYGCYCGFLGTGQPVDHIDRCCLEHDWCYTHASCPQMFVYFVPYEWSCITPGYAHCGIMPFGGLKDKCSYQLCQCDRAFAKCLSRMPCPIDKPICQSSPFIAIQNIIIG